MHLGTWDLLATSAVHVALKFNLPTLHRWPPGTMCPDVDGLVSKTKTKEKTLLKDKEKDKGTSQKLRKIQLQWQKQVPHWLFSEIKLKRYRFYENLVNSRTTQACTFFLAMHLILPFKSSAKFLNVLVLSGIFGRDIRCDVNKRFTPRWQEVCGKYQK